MPHITDNILNNLMYAQQRYILRHSLHMCKQFSLSAQMHTQMHPSARTGTACLAYTGIQMNVGSVS